MFFTLALLSCSYFFPYCLQDFLKKMKSTKSIPKHFKDNTLVLDPDLIDLTMIPPPMTPDEVQL